jgi:hypothetical protein
MFMASPRLACGRPGRLIFAPCRVRIGRHKPAAGGLERQEAIMAKMSSTRLTDEDRAERRRQDRARLQHAAQELLSSDGWARWVKTRAMFHSYSVGNCMLLAAQARGRSDPRRRVPNLAEAGAERPAG